ncbi:hypothetical protein FPRO05_14246 [Fusarium proliferatum]|uniref:Major facilitator superfamily (MFS) profile domain-containing protein n=1 Tax=Gibberella intermedia TaxID=948311 RepID=A0A365MT86_GIBIN|nr:hypothetical protein FPRO05_14246 [Fusarium proliferatum]
MLTSPPVCLCSLPIIKESGNHASIYLPVINSFDSITGPTLGVILVRRMGKEYPYLAPNILSTSLLALSVVVPAWVDKIISCDSKVDPARSTCKDLSRTTILILFTYRVFQLSNISFNSLYPIFAATPPPAGHDLLSSKIGMSLSIAGLANCIFQAFLSQALKVRLGNLGTCQISLLGLGISMLLMPWVGHANSKPSFGLGNGKMWLCIELGVVLILQNLLGSLNGMAQTLSALGRSFGPFVLGGLFSLSINIQLKGEALAWSIFGGLAIWGWVSSLFIRRDGLESDDWLDSEENLAEQEADAA